mgnify:CR=1 FL=1
MSDVHLEYINEVYIRVNTSTSILLELASIFEYKIENAAYNPLVKRRLWNGMVTLVNRQTGICLSGLTQRIKKYCDNSGYTITFDNELYYDNISKIEFDNHIKSLNIPDNYVIRDYQYDAALKSIKSRRRLLLSPVNSGKTLISYLITSWYEKQGLKTLYIVPTIDLISQFIEDMENFGYNKPISTSYKGLDKSNNIKEEIVCTTWQSLNNGKTKMPKEWYKQFDIVCGDECHQHKAKCVKECLESLTECKYRFGMTGSLSGVDINDMTIEGLFGPQYITTTTDEMIKKKYSSKLNIKCIILKYPENIAKKIHDKYYSKEDLVKKYHDEIEFLINCKERNTFITNLTKSLKGNRLVFFKNINHGLLLKNMLEGNDTVYHIDGDTDSIIRSEIRNKLKNYDSNSILVASYGTVSTGISISTLKHMISGHPNKSKIKVLQSIGRMLRTDKIKEKEGAVLYDIVDNITYQGKENYTLDHFRERIKIYKQEKYDYKIYNISIKVADEPS